MLFSAAFQSIQQIFLFLFFSGSLIASPRPAIETPSHGRDICKSRGPLLVCYKPTASVPSLYIRYYNNGTLWSTQLNKPNSLKAYYQVNGSPGSIVPLTFNPENTFAEVTLPRYENMGWAVQVAITDPSSNRWDSLDGQNYQFLLVIPSPQDASIFFSISGVATHPGQYLAVLGDWFGLGQGYKDGALALTPKLPCQGEYCVWTGDATIPAGVSGMLSWQLLLKGYDGIHHCGQAFNMSLNYHSIVTMRPDNVPGIQVASGISQVKVITQSCSATPNITTNNGKV